MQLLAVGHKRTGACPTFERPVLQRDGLLLRIPLVGGALTGSQLAVIADVAASCGSGTVELTNRGNLQLRGIRDDVADVAQARIRASGLGERGAALVTISPFASSAEHALRTEVLAALEAILADGPALSPKFVVHVDDAAGWTGSRRAEAVLAVDGEHGCRVRIAGLGQQRTSDARAIATVRALADRCREQGDQARVADVLERAGAKDLATQLPMDPAGWGQRSTRPVAFDGLGPLGAVTGPDGRRLVVAAAPLGRVEADVLRGLGSLGSVRVTPWRSFASTARAEDLRGLGLIVDRTDPAAGVVSCIGAAGCWQTEADTLDEAQRQIDRRAVGASVLPVGAGVLHVSGCDKRCATRSVAAVTLVGRTDGSGFVEVRA